MESQPHHLLPDLSPFKRSANLLLSLDQYCKAVNLVLANRLLMLPRELRDMVYAHVWCDEKYKTGAQFKSLRYGLLHPSLKFLKISCPGPPCNCLKDLPHFVNLNFVGAVVAREMLEHIKETLQDHEAPLLKIAGPDIVAFVEKDVFHVGISLEAVFRGIDFRIDIGEGDTWYSYAEFPQRKTWLKDTARMQEAVSSLRLIPFEHKHTRHAKYKSSVRKIWVNLRDYGMPLNDLEVLLRIFGPCFAELNGRGFDITLSHHSDVNMSYYFGNQTWTWSASEWEDQLWAGSSLYKNDSCESMGMNEQWTSERDVEAWRPKWALIMRYIYQLNPSGGMDQEGHYISA